MGITDARSVDPNTDPDESVTQASGRAAVRPWLVPHRGVLAIAWLLLAGCTVGPKYVRPTTDVPSDYKEAGSEFKQAEPRDQIAKGKWWEIYDDPRLNSLEERISVSNQTLKAQQAQFVEARAALRIARAQLYPTASASLSASRTGQSQNRALFSNPARQVYNDFALPYWDWTADRQTPPAFVEPTFNGQPNPLFEPQRDATPTDSLPDSTVGPGIIIWKRFQIIPQ